SDAQRRPLPWLSWAGTVYHGLPLESYPYSERSRGYLAFLGRISPEKGLDQAIEIARRAGRRLRIAAKIDRADRDYFETEIRSLPSQPHVEFVGEIRERDKAAFLGGADALLFPVCWPEPFGLVMVESMACGTPVIGYPRGSVPEIVENGVNGFVVENEAQGVEAVWAPRAPPPPPGPGGLTPHVPRGP